MKNCFPTPFSITAVRQNYNLYQKCSKESENVVFKFFISVLSYARLNVPSKFWLENVVINNIQCSFLLATGAELIFLCIISAKVGSVATLFFVQF